MFFFQQKWWMFWCAKIEQESELHTQSLITTKVYFCTEDIPLTDDIKFNRSTYCMKITSISNPEATLIMLIKSRRLKKTSFKTESREINMSVNKYMDTQSMILICGQMVLDVHMFILIRHVRYVIQERFCFTVDTTRIRTPIHIWDNSQNRKIYIIS